MNATQNEWLTVQEAAAFLKLAKQTVYQKVHEKKIPCYKPENSSVLRFRKSELESWLQSGKREVLC
jgi:excisionase family DNA binding protein